VLLLIIWLLQVEVVQVVEAVLITVQVVVVQVDFVLL
jgi:hypothetical protein